MNNQGRDNASTAIGYGRSLSPPDGPLSTERTTTQAPPLRIRIEADGDADKAIRDYLTQLLLEHHSEYQRPYLAFPYGGLPTSVDRFEFLDDPSKLDEAYSFARLVNSIPDFDLQGRWFFTSNQLVDEYTYWLDHYVPPPISITKKEEKQLRKAREYCAENFAVYWSFRTDFYNADSEYEAWLYMPVGDRPKDYEQKLKAAYDKVELTRQEWELKGHRSEYEANYAKVEELSRRDPALTKQTLRELMGQPYISRLGEFYWTSLLPGNAFASDDSWLRYEIEFGESEATMPLMERRASDRRAVPVAEIPLTGTRITFEMVRLAIDRAWFAAYLLNSNDWKWADSTPLDPFAGYPLSDGAAQPVGHLVMIPKEVLFVRNKQVDSQTVGKFLSDGPSAKSDKSTWLSFGPFGLGGSEETKNLQGSAPGAIEISQMEYFAFMCELLPMEPNPNWHLWPIL